MNILITGGSGYLGSLLVNKFHENNHQIFNLDVLNSNNQKALNISVDLLNYESLQEVFLKYKFDIIIHNAAKVPISHSKKSYYENNVLGTKNLLYLFEKYNVKKFVYISSSAVYGVPNKVPITENDIRNPVESYGLSKKIAEDECMKFIDKKNITILRPRTILGEDRMGIFSILFTWISMNSKVPVFNNGKNLYQFIDARDFIDAAYLSAFSSYSGSLNIGSENFTSIRDLIENLIKRKKSKSIVKNIDNNYLIKIGKALSKFQIIPLKDYHFAAYGKDIYFDTTLAQKTLKWNSKFSNIDSLENSYDNFIINKSKNNDSPHKRKINNFIMKNLSYLI